MKKLLLVSLFAFFGIALHAQTKVPAAVTEAFAKEHPGKNANWNEDDNNYRASFKVDDLETVVLYKADGSLVQTEEELPTASIPSSITNYATFQRWGSIKKAMKVTTSVGIVSYYVKIKDGNAIFNDKGNFLRFAKD